MGTCRGLFASGMPTAAWRSLVFGLMLISVASTQSAYAEEPEKPEDQAKAIEFNSELSLEVHVWHDGKGKTFSTPSTNPIIIPADATWFVQPVGETTLDDLIKEAQAKSFPGIRLPWSATDADIARVNVLKQLRTLDLWNCDDITDAGLAQLKDLKQLQTLDLDSTKITDAGLAHLTQLKQLQTLNLAFCDQITDAGLAHLKELKRLQTLDLHDCDKITDAGVRQLREALPDLNIER